MARASELIELAAVKKSSSPKRHVRIGCLILSSMLLSSCSSVPVRDNYVRNGDFEKTGDGELIPWESVGKVKAETVSGEWRRYTLRFNSGAFSEVKFFFHVNKWSAGSIWIDNVTCADLRIVNGSFEELDAGGGPAGWTLERIEPSPWAGLDTSPLNVTLFVESSRVADGKRSIRMTHEHEMVPMTRLFQTLSVQPNRDYAISYDILVGDDFQGEGQGYVYETSGTGHLTANYLEVSVAEELETRDRCGRYAVSLIPSEKSPSEVSQEMTVRPGMNFVASVDVNNKLFTGTVGLLVEDAATGATLAESSRTEVKPTWQSLTVSCQSASARLRMRVRAEGKGTVRIDNAEVALPGVMPPLQQVQWLPAAENFNLTSHLEVSVQGPGGRAIEGGLELLGKDLKQHNVTLTRTNSVGAPLKIIIASGHEVKGKGPESYSLAVMSKGITIKAGTESGAFYGLMTLLQLIERRDDKAVVLACEAIDYPDLPMRGVLYGDAEQAARWKMNTFVESAGYPVSAEQKKAFSDSVRKCEKLNQKYIPYALAMMGGLYVQRINPNLAAGIWVRDEKLTLRGTEPSPLANPYVIRTQLTDVKLKSSDGTKEYKLGVDYQVIDGDMGWNYDAQNPKRFAVARLPGSAIPDGATVLASYDWVSHHRAPDVSPEAHVAYVPLEPEARRLMDEFLSNVVREYPIPYTLFANCLHEFRPTELQLATDSRVIRSGKKPIQLFAEDITAQSVAVKRGNPAAKAMFWAGNMNDHYVRAAEPFISRDAHVQIWGYDANWPSAYGREAIRYWSTLGFESSVMSWDNLRNVRGWAQVVAEARAKGYPCLGMINACWANRTGGFQETAVVCWKVPREGEKGFVSLDSPKSPTARRLSRVLPPGKPRGHLTAGLLPIDVQHGGKR